MKKTKAQKGITLIALIITIVVLLILAAVAIGSIQNDGILSYTENVVNKYNQSQRDEQGVLDQYLGYLKGEQWITIYEGRETTVEGFAVIANKHLFKVGGTYKITVESDEFSGTVETKAILIGAESGQQYYLLFGVIEGQVVTVNTFAEYVTILENLPEDAIYSNIFGANISDSTNGNMSAMGNMECTSLCEYTITKIEEKVEKIENNTVEGELIFEGPVSIGSGVVTLVGVKSEMVATRKYRVDLMTSDGQVYSKYLEAIDFLGYDYFVELIDGEKNLNNTEVGITSINGTYGISAKYEAILMGIYDVGPAETNIGENEFIATKRDGAWTLIRTPDTSYVIPETVSGVTIEVVDLSSISGVPTFVKPIGFTKSGFVGEESFVENIKVVTSEQDVINELLTGISDLLKSSMYGNSTSIDLTECGDDIELPSGFTAFKKVYVTQAVKDRYTAYSNVVVPES